jgi:uncharacterized membrane protein YraQ (UPF0718 family)
MSPHIVEGPSSPSGCCGPEPVVEKIACCAVPKSAGRSRSSAARTLSWLVAALAAWAVAYAAVFPLSELLTYNVLGLSRQSHLGQSVAFFLYDAPKVLLLLTLIVFVVGVVQSFFSPVRARSILAGKRESVGNILAALLGGVTPFCSCSAVPLFLGFVEVGSRSA